MQNDNQHTISIALNSAINQRDYSLVLLLARNLEPTTPDYIESLSSAAAALLSSEKWDNVIEIGRKVFAADAFHINTLDAMSHAYGGKRDWVNCAVFGGLALQLRDKEILAKYPKLPVLPKFTPNPNGKNIIAFSLFGDKPAYIEPAVLNAQLVADIYPNWICRFYVDDSVPEQAIERLKNPHTEIVHVGKELGFLAKTMWRFLALDDPNANYVIFRDADSVISQREAAAVEEWIASGKRFHTIRDSGSHTELILAGLWGARAGSLPNMQKLMHNYMVENPTHHRFSDQYFLKERLWAYVRQDLYASDRVFGFMQPHPIPQQAFFNFDITHIGCDEGSSRFNLETTDVANFPAGCEIVWQLHSQIDGLLNLDLSYNLVPERVICEYRTTLKDAGKFSDNVPRRYARGFNDNTSRITFKRIK